MKTKLGRDAGYNGSTLQGAASCGPRRIVPNVMTLIAATFSALAYCGSAHAQSAAPGSSVVLDTIVVTAEGGTESPDPDRAEGDPAAIEQKTAERRLEAIPGGTAIVTRQELSDRADVTIGDSLSAAPGVVVQTFFGGNDQPRIQIRGSGLQQNPVERGILVLRDGMPLNRADGSYLVGLMDPRQAQFIEIYRGYTANRLGATVLGGAINFISPTGTTAPGVSFGIDGGSFGQVTTSAGAGGSQGNMDGYAQVSYTQRDGFREYNDSDRTDVNLNMGARISDVVSTRLFVGYTDLGFDVPGPLSWDKLKQDPRQVSTGPTVTLTPSGPVMTNPGPNVPRDKPNRDAQQFRAGARTSADFGDHRLEYVIGYSFTDDAFQMPIGSGNRSTDGGDLTNVIRYAYIHDASQILPLFEATAMYVTGSADRDFHENIDGNQGLRFGANELRASTLSLQAGMNISVVEGVTVSPSIAYSYATRENDDLFGSGFRPVAGFNPVTGAFQTAVALPQDTSYSHSYSGWTPSLGVMFDVGPDSALFAAVSRSFEPPTHDDLLVTVNGTSFFSPGAPSNGVLQYAFDTPDLKAQKATTIEGGWRGQTDRFSWDAVVYYSWIRDELLSLRDPTGARLPSQNADRTTHFGVELGLGARITDALSARLAYTFQRFRFDNDPVHGNNQLAGAPEHVVNAALRYAITPEWSVEGSVNWWPDRIPVDNANTLFSEPWATFGARTVYQVNDNFSLYAEVRNIFDEVYASSVLITDTAIPDQAAFLPGDGRAFYVGLRARM